jgi:heat shock protein beta
MLSLADLG